LTRPPAPLRRLTNFAPQKEFGWCLFVPTEFRVLHDLCQFADNSECRNWALPDMPERLQRALQAISPQIGYLDLTPYLVEAARTAEFPYYRDDEHWTPAGHKVAAETMSHYLKMAGSQ
jgi:SGNH hydrolase-like domain, acetyltransferase AlgX